MKTEWLHSKFPSQTEMIGHLYDRAVDDDEDAAKDLDIYLTNRSDWKQFKNNIQKDDEIWFYRSEVESWRKNSGREGYCIFRKNKSVECSNFTIEQQEIIDYFQTVGPI